MIVTVAPAADTAPPLVAFTVIEPVSSHRTNSVVV
jgi:hypothetical protein